MQTKESPNQSLQGIPNKLTGEYMYRWPEITSTWFLNIKLGGCPQNNRAHLAHLYWSQIKVFLHKNNRELIDFKSSTAYALLISVVYCTLFTSSITPQVTFLTWVASEEVMLSISSSKLVVPTVTNTVFMSAQRNCPGFLNLRTSVFISSTSSSCTRRPDSYFRFRADGVTAMTYNASWRHL